VSEEEVDGSEDDSNGCDEIAEVDACSRGDVGFEMGVVEKGGEEGGEVGF